MGKSNHSINDNNNSKKDIKSLHKKVIKKINQLECILQNEEEIKIINDFKNLFNVCETTCKEILFNYLRNKKNEKVKKESIRLNMNQIHSAFAYAEYNIDNNILAKIFGSKTEKNNKSVKVLRNFVTHDLRISEIKEIINRKKELFDLMNDYLKILKNTN